MLNRVPKPGSRFDSDHFTNECPWAAVSHFTASGNGGLFYMTDDFELDGYRPVTGRISVITLERIYNLLSFSLLHGEFEFFSEYQMVEDVLQEVQKAIDEALYAKK